MDTGVCTTCGAEDVELNADTEVCTDCEPKEAEEGAVPAGEEEEV